MDKTQETKEVDKAVMKADRNKEAWLFLAIIILFPALMIYLELSGVDTGQALQNLFGYIFIGAALLGVGALVLAVIVRVFGFIIGK